MFYFKLFIYKLIIRTGERERERGSEKIFRQGSMGACKGGKEGPPRIQYFLLRILLLGTLLGKNKTCSQNQEEASEFDG